MRTSTRRHFLTTTSRAAIGLAVGTSAASARPIPSNAIRSGRATQTFLPASMGPDTLGSFATAAIEAARGAGAVFADVRVAERQFLRVGQHINNELAPDVTIDVRFSYGVRVFVDGIWAFGHGTIPSSDALAAAAKNAVATARGTARVARPQLEFAGTPVVTGVWTSPSRIDPFTVPLEEQVALLWAWKQATMRPRGGMFSGQFEWTQETRVFASSEGSRTTQTIRRSWPRAATRVGPVELKVPAINAVTAGYEFVLGPDLQDRMKTNAEEAARLARLPVRSLDVGRYPVVFSGLAMAKILGSMLGPALELDRVLGEEADASGTSFLAPVDAVLGAPLFPPFLQVTAARAVPTFTAMQWDDEGVSPQEYPVIADGCVVDYHSCRRTAPALRSWYQRRGIPVQSRGCAIALEADSPVHVRTPHQIVRAAAQSATIEDLCKDVRRGILVLEDPWVSTDQQLASGNVNGGVMLEIDRGQIVGRIARNGLEFSARALWKALAGLGDVTTVRTCDMLLHKGQPWIHAPQTSTAPAGIFSGVNVIATGRRF
jgi:TldD protein